MTDNLTRRTVIATVTRESLAADMGHRLRTLRIAGGYSSIAAYARSLGLPVSTVRRLVGTRRVYPDASMR
jgi:hypothetical protein